MLWWHIRREMPVHFVDSGEARKPSDASRQAWEAARDVAAAVFDENSSNDLLQGEAARRLLDTVASGPQMAGL